MSQPTQPETDLIGVLTAIFSSKYSDTKVGWQEMARFTLEYLSANGYTITPKARSTPAGAPQAPDLAADPRLAKWLADVKEWEDDDSRGAGESFDLLMQVLQIIRPDEDEPAAPTLPGSSTAPDLRERLAALCHDQWSGWMRYLFEKCEDIQHPDGEDGEKAVTIPAWAVYRWGRQLQTPYERLSEEEKESDRKEADRFLALLGAAGSSTEAGGLREAAEYLLSELERPTGLRADQDSPIAQWFRGVINAAEMLRSALAAGPQYHGNDLDDTEAWFTRNYPEHSKVRQKALALVSEVRRLRAHGNDLEAAAKRSYEILSAWFARQRPIDQAAGTGTMIKVIIKELGDALSLRAQGGDAGAGV